MKWKILVKFSPFIVVVVAFGIFILWNGGIVLGTVFLFSYRSFHLMIHSYVQVVFFTNQSNSKSAGAKEAHVVSPHFGQIMYFSLVSALFTAPLHFSVEQVRNLLQELRRNWPLSLLLTLVALIAGFASVHFFRFSFLTPLKKPLKVFDYKLSL